MYDCTYHSPGLMYACYTTGMGYMLTVDWLMYAYYTTGMGYMLTVGCRALELKCWSWNDSGILY